MKFLLIQERGRHEANREFREALSMQRALIDLGHEAIVWGLGYDNFVIPFDDISRHCDAVLFMEQYDQTGWTPDISGFKGPRVFWTIDSHCSLQEHIRQFNRQNITHILSSTRAYLDYYNAPGVQKHWFPNCYDDTLIRPIPEAPKVHPVGFCGNVNNRGPWLDRLDLYLQTYAPKYGQVKRDVFVIGQDMVKAINSYQIHFNRNIMDDLNYRTFETLGCKTLLFTNSTPGLEELFDIGWELITYGSFDDLSEKVRYFLENPNEAQVIAEAGYQRVKRQHTYRNRAVTLCNILASI